MKIFGREPAAWIGFAGAVLTALAGLNLPGLNAGQASAIVAFLTAALIAATTRPITPALLTGGITVLVALLAEYGTNVPEQWIATVTAVSLAVLSFILRGQVTPASDPRPTAVV